MVWIDILIVLIVVLYAILGWRRGFITGLVELIGLGIALIAGLFLYRYIAPLFSGTEARALSAGVIAFLLIFLLVYFLVEILAALLIRRIPMAVTRSIPNRAFGVLLGAAKGILVCAIAVMLLASLPIGISKDSIGNSAIGGWMLSVASHIDRAVTALVPEDVRRGLTFVTVPPEERQSVKVPATSDIRVDPEAERQMLVLLNRERTRRGLRPLTMDPRLRAVAREHSADMFRRGYFSHISPEGTNPFQRMRRAGISFATAGENLALAPTVRIAHQGLMESPGHRENILRPAFGKVGIGAYSNPWRGKMFTQVFSN